MGRATMPHGITFIAAIILMVSTSLACQTNEDCLLLGTCEQGQCQCRQGFTGPECGQIDLDPAPTHLGYRNRTASSTSLLLHSVWSWLYHSTRWLYRIRCANPPG
jgi:hypothetical protein